MAATPPSPPITRTQSRTGLLVGSRRVIAGMMRGRVMYGGRFERASRSPAAAKARAERRASGQRGRGPAKSGAVSSTARAMARPNNPPQTTNAIDWRRLLPTRSVTRLQIEVGLQHLLHDRPGGERAFAAVVYKGDDGDLGVVGGRVADEPRMFRPLAIEADTFALGNVVAVFCRATFTGVRNLLQHVRVAVDGDFDGIEAGDVARAGDHHFFHAAPDDVEPLLIHRHRVDDIGRGRIGVAILDDERAELITAGCARRHEVA